MKPQRNIKQVQSLPHSVLISVVSRFAGIFLLFGGLGRWSDFSNWVTFLRVRYPSLLFLGKICGCSVFTGTILSQINLMQNFPPKGAQIYPRCTLQSHSNSWGEKMWFELALLTWPLLSWRWPVFLVWSRLACSHAARLLGAGVEMTHHKQ